MKRALAVLMAVAVVALMAASSASAATNELFSRLTGGQEVPGPGDDNGTGAALVNLKPADDEVCAGVRFRKIAGATLMHIHAGAKGVSGPIVVDLGPILGGARCVDATGTTVDAISADPNDFYVNVHNGAFPAGAIRGQLNRSDVASGFRAETGTGHQFARLNGNQEQPGPGDANGRGAAFVDLNPLTGEICVNPRYRRIETPTLMHIHRGDFGVAGPIVVNLTTLLGNPAGGCVTASMALTQEIQDFPERFYCNIHNTPFPNGAIRGQLETSIDGT